MADDETTGATAKRVNLPLYYASGFQAIWSGNDLSLLLTSNSPVLLPDGGFAAAPLPVAILSMSPQSAKDLLWLLKDGVRAYEETYGEIETDFIRDRLASSAGSQNADSE